MKEVCNTRREEEKNILFVLFLKEIVEVHIKEKREDRGVIKLNVNLPQNG